MNKIFYKMKMAPTEGGLAIFTDKFYSIRETKHTHFCVSENGRGFLNGALRQGSETDIQLARRLPAVKVFRIYKANSRIAFESEEKAFSHLLEMKLRQIDHLKLNIRGIELFLKKVEGKSLSDFPEDYYTRMIPETSDFVNANYRFD